MARCQAASVGRPRSRRSDVASAVSVVAAAVVLLFNPLWVGFEQAQDERRPPDGLQPRRRPPRHERRPGRPHRRTGDIPSAGRWRRRLRPSRAPAPRRRARRVQPASSRWSSPRSSILVVAAVRTRDRAWLWRSVATGTRALAIVVRRRRDVRRAVLRHDVRAVPRAPLRGRQLHLRPAPRTARPAVPGAVLVGDGDRARGRNPSARHRRVADRVGPVADALELGRDGASRRPDRTARRRERDPDRAHLRHRGPDPCQLDRDPRDHHGRRRAAARQQASPTGATRCDGPSPPAWPSCSSRLSSRTSSPTVSSRATTRYGRWRGDAAVLRRRDDPGPGTGTTGRRSARGGRGADREPPCRDRVHGADRCRRGDRRAPSAMRSRSSPSLSPS